MTATSLYDARSAASSRARWVYQAGLRSLSLMRVACVLGLGFIISCGGNGGMGCSGLTPIKGGYPVQKRLEGAMSVRLSKGLFDFLEQNGALLAGQLLPADGITVPGSCGGSTEICCNQTCKIKLTFSSLKIDPRPPASLLTTIRTKLKTENDFTVSLPVIGSCQMSFDSTRQGNPDVGIALPVDSSVNADTKLTSINFNTSGLDLLDIDSGDISLSGGWRCSLTDAIKGLFIGTIKDQIKNQLAGPLGGVLCQKCESNDDCSSLADMGCAMDKKVCMRQGTCIQELGFSGRLDLASLLGALPGGGKDAAIDIYAVAGSYAAVEPAPTAGMSLGLLGGAVAPKKSACVPMRPAPMYPNPLGKTPAYAGNTAPNGMPFHVGAGISTLELDTLGHAFYESGGMCLTIETAQVEQLSAGLVSGLIPSLMDLTRGENAAMAVVVKPQYPPTFGLGKGTFKTDGTGKKTIDDPLLRLKLKDLAIDFYVYMDERMVRFMRHTVDLDVPVGLDVDNLGQLIPIIGSTSGVLSNPRVTGSALLKESPDDLKKVLPSLIPTVLGLLTSQLKPIALPTFLGLKLQPVQFTSTTDSGGKLAYLGLFLALEAAKMPLSANLFAPYAATAPAAKDGVETYADLVALDVPPLEQLAVNAPDWASATVRATLQLGAKSPMPGNLEWQYRIDAGMWQPFDDKRLVTIDDAVLRLPGKHVIEVRARVAGSPNTLDPTPARVEFLVAPAPSQKALPKSDPAAATSGCAMSSGHTSEMGSVLFLIAATLSLLGLRRRRPGRATLLHAGLCLVAGLTATACQKDETARADMMAEEKPHPELNPADEIGRYQSAVLRDGTIYLSAYDSTTGDLAFTSVGFDDAPSAKLVWLPVDGLPTGAAMKKSKDAYRGGFEAPGDDVGKFTALALSQNGTPVIAYQDVTNGAVKIAAQPDPQKSAWQIATLSTPAEGKLAGSFISMVLDANDVPTLAYRVQGVKKAGGKRAAQLVVARAGTKDPAGTEGWQKTVVAEAATSCAGLCDTDEACVYADPVQKDRLATACKPIEENCAKRCPGTQVCIAKECVEPLAAMPSEPEGTGLYAKLVAAPDRSSLYLVFHDSSKGTLNVASGTDWKVTTLDGGDGKTAVGRGIGAAVAQDGTLHVAYGNSAQRLLYRKLSGGMLSEIEVIDDGMRNLGGLTENHFVGGGLHLFIDGTEPAVAYQDRTLGTLEVARRSGMGWAHGTLSPEDNQSHGYYPQAVMRDGRWLILDVVYTRTEDALFSSIAFSPL